MAAVLVLSATLVAMTVTLPATAGAVSTPVAEIVPAEADHVTALLATVPATEAVNCCVAPVEMLAVVGEMDTEFTVGAAMVTVADAVFVGSAKLVTVIFAVPRIFERFQARIAQSLKDAPLKRLLFGKCVLHGFRAKTGTGSLVDRLFASALQPVVGKPVLRRLGGRMRIAVVGGAALDPELARTFIGLGLAMLQGYGMTEASPVISVNRVDHNVPESVGPPGANPTIMRTGRVG